MNFDDQISLIYQRYSVMPGSTIKIQSIKSWWPNDKIHLLGQYLQEIEKQGLIEIVHDSKKRIESIRRLHDQFKIETWDRSKSTLDSYQTITLYTKSGKIIIDVFYVKDLESKGKPYLIQISDVNEDEESYYRFKKTYQTADEAFENYISINKTNLSKMEFLSNAIETEENSFISKQAIKGILLKYNILSS